MKALLVCALVVTGCGADGPAASDAAASDAGLPARWFEGSCVTDDDCMCFSRTFGMDSACNDEPGLVQFWCIDTKCTITCVTVEDCGGIGSEVSVSKSVGDGVRVTVKEWRDSNCCGGACVPESDPACWP